MPVPWQPTRFVRFEESIGTSTRPARIVTDDGAAFLKAVNNPIGPHALVREFLGTSLARWIGLDTLDFALIQVVSDDEIPIKEGLLASPGTAFVTRAVGGHAHTWDGTAEDLDLVDNPEAVALLVAFDTWTLNADRYPPPTIARKPNPDNVFLTPEGASRGRFRLLAFDHSECLGGTGRDLSGALAKISRIKDPEVYGLFPEFKNRITQEDLAAAAKRLGGFSRTTIEALVAEIPADWSLSAGAAAALCELITQRAAYVSENLVLSVSQACGKLAL